jgi:hypothetical protein
LYGGENWCLILREARKLRVFENRVLKKVFGPKTDELTGHWRRLHNEELYDLYCPPNIIQVIKSCRIRWAGHILSMGYRKGVYRILVRENLRKKEHLVRPRRRWEDNFKMDIQDVRRYMAWITVAQDRDR